MDGKYSIKGVGVNVTNTLGITKADLFYCPICDFDRIKTVELTCEDNVIVSTKFLDGIVDHIEIFQNTTDVAIDILLISSSCDFERYIEVLEKVKKNYPFIKLGIYIEDDCTVSRIEDIYNQVGYTISLGIFGMKLNPSFFRADIIKYADDYSYEIIGFDCFGSKYMRNYLIDSFTKPYLLEFAAYYCHALILGGEDIEITDLRYATSLVDREVTNESLFTLSTTVNSEYPKLKKMISFNVDFEGDKLVLPDLNGVLPVPESINYSFGNSAKEEITSGSPKKSKRDEDYNDLIEFLDAVYKPEDDVDNEGYFNMLKNEVNLYLKKKVESPENKKEKYRIGDCFSLSRNVALFSLEEKKLVKRYYLVPNIYEYVPTVYLLAVTEDGNYLFKKIK
jgi:hypothetical protein